MSGRKKLRAREPDQAPEDKPKAKSRTRSKPKPKKGDGGED